VSDLFDEPDHATPLAPEDSELNEAEQENIARAQDWALASATETCLATYGNGPENSGPANAISGYPFTRFP
jgi:hypothetical protein